MKALAYRILNSWQRRRHGPRVEIASSARLLRSFDVRFLATPEARPYLRIGAESFINGTFIFEARTGQVSIGKRCYIGKNCTAICRERITIGDDVTMAWDIMLYDHDSHSLDWRDRRNAVRHFYDHYGTARCFDELDWTKVRSAPITIGDRAWLGFGVVVLKGVNIGEGAIVGARAVVTRDVEPYTIVAGNPAQPIRRLGPSHQASED